MELNDVEIGKPVIYQDEKYTVLSVDWKGKKALIEQAQCDGPGAVISRFVSPDQLEAIRE